MTISLVTITIREAEVPNVIAQLTIKQFLSNKHVKATDIWEPSFRDRRISVPEMNELKDINIDGIQTTNSHAGRLEIWKIMSPMGIILVECRSTHHIL